MKTFLQVALLGVLASSAQADVAAVRREVARVDALKLSVQTQTRTDLSTEGARISVRRDAKGAPRKIDADITGEGGRKHETIYLQNGAPLFVYSVEERYDKPMYLPDFKVVSRIETRLYFEKGRLIQKRVGKKILELSRAQARQLQRETVDEVRDFLKPGNDESSG